MRLGVSRIAYLVLRARADRHDARARDRLERLHEVVGDPAGPEDAPGERGRVFFCAE